MNNVFWQILRAVLLLFVQIVVLNNIQLFGMVSPFLYTLIIITLPIKMPRNYVMLLGCLIGCV
ncbi:MAG TPA: rod shape-determining protein MreD, partial [Paludibacteraceae bacterium]|nr:rod shape-determining protein MreD [Paludibacteraceae bacterium]